jgi:hypothetical protein
VDRVLRPLGPEDHDAVRAMIVDSNEVGGRSHYDAAERAAFAAYIAAADIAALGTDADLRASPTASSSGAPAGSRSERLDYVGVRPWPTPVGGGVTIGSLLMRKRVRDGRREVAERRSGA